MKQAFIVFIWTLVLLYLISWGIEMLNQANTLVNYGGLIGIILLIMISVKYKFGTTIKLFKTTKNS